ncbi:MAG TPA: sigma-70 family RNA polymerase sigma factor [Tepidisphaeraceae bacterium]|jgi:RNA polymerase sigma-70 factor (ECF subfamily)
MSTITAEPDFVLLERFKQTRDPEAFREIVRRYTGAVFATCFRILHDPGTAEDAAQETFFRLMTRPQRVTASLGGWLHRAATRLALDIRRSDGSRRRRELARTVPEPIEASDWAEVAPVLDEALAALPETHRELLIRHFFRGESQANLAMEMQTSAATLSRRMKAAIDALREELTHRGLCVAPALLFTLLAKNGASSAPAALQLAMGKMALFCTAQHAGRSMAVAKVSLGAVIRNFPRSVYAVRWALAAAILSLAAALLVAALCRHAHTPIGSWGHGQAVRAHTVEARTRRPAAHAGG